MGTGINIGEFLAGLGFFLLGMQQLERALNGIFGRSLRLTLRRYTEHPFQGIAVGTVATAILQSSSLVTLMLLAFVGAGILTLGNALGVILGANLGTTMTGWLVTAIGFKLELEVLALPAIGLGALGVVFIAEERRIARFSALILGLGMLLFGLELMKTSADAFASGFDPAVLQRQPLIVFLAVGFGFTLIVQSSSAAMMANLAALSAGVLTLPDAAALAIGADLGTTIKVILGGLDASPPRRRVALAHFLFNLVTDLVAFVLLTPLLWLVTEVFGISDPLFALVAFHSTFNLLGIAMFYPFINRFAAFLETRFVDAQPRVARFITELAVNVPEAALESLEREARHLFAKVMRLNAATLRLQEPRLPRQFSEADDNEELTNFRAHYERIKELEGEMLGFEQALQEQSLDENEAARLAQLQIATRHAVHAAKAVKDIRQNLDAAEDSDDGLAGLLAGFREYMDEIYIGIGELLSMERAAGRLAELSVLAESNERLHAATTRAIHAVKRGRLTEIELSTALNMNRELYSSNKALLSGLKELLLPPEEARDLGDIRGLD
ncbi:MAG: Na/Pi symporter [Gammaproteobacteria bacterium]|nr:Na/Pi symporter [Gammaproteobacteria bacterium]